MIDNVQQKNNSIQGKPEKKASLLLPIIVAAVIFVAMVVSILVSNNIIRLVVEDDDFTKCYQIDNCGIVDNQLIIDGWCFRLTMDTVDLNGKDVYPKQRIVLMKIDNNSDGFISMDTVSGIRRDDVNNYFKCEYDYSNSGFSASIDINRLKLDTDTYEILIQFDDSIEKAFNTGVFIDKGIVKYCTCEDMDFENEYLNNVAKNGMLRVYRPDKGMYVYQMDGELYWILDENFAFEEDNSTEIQYQLYTTQIENLPQNMKDVGAKGDNLSFAFENEEEIDGLDDSEYRLCITDIPTGYSISKIKTGYHDGKEWKWEQFFRPRYEF